LRAVAVLGPRLKFVLPRVGDGLLEGRGLRVGDLVAAEIYFGGHGCFWPTPFEQAPLLFILFYSTYSFCPLEDLSLVFINILLFVQFGCSAYELLQIDNSFVI
jgi:hypothetical protein